MSTALTEPRNRLLRVLSSPVVNGIDFVELPAVDATTLYVHFLNGVTVQPVAPAVLTATITGGDRIQGILVSPIDPATAWSVDPDGRPLLTLTVNRPGDFSTYTLTLTGGPLDPLYTAAAFSFKVLCPSDFDCAPKSACCPPNDPSLPAIDYTAKDFQSFKLALTDFSAQRYPSWQERSEADLGVMFLESLAFLADELSYLQDRVATESSLLTATQRRSLVSLARLVDYEPTPQLSASTLIQCNVSGTAIPAGTLLTATSPDGVTIPFEVGLGLSDTFTYPVSPAWNAGIQPYWFDDSEQCLPCRSTSMYLLGQGFAFTAGQSLLIQTDLPGESIRELLTLTSATELTDPIFLDSANSPTAITRITWAFPTTRDHVLTHTTLAGNLLPATQGQRFTESFAVGTLPPGSSGIQLALARYGPNATQANPNWIIRYPLSRSNPAQGRLTWLPATSPGNSVVDPDVAEPTPELLLTRRLPEPAPFTFATTLLDATATENAVTIDPAAWRVVATDGLGVVTQWEYDGDGGDTLRFGDGTFGAQPNDGDLFDVTYRIGLGAAGNVAAGAIQNVAPASTAPIVSVTNPFPVTNGADAESAQHIQRMAPQAFRAVQYRAVRPEDYQSAAQTLPWVLKAGTSFRWTGSWLSVFTIADPKASPSGAANATLAQQTDLIDLLNRRRLAGYESFAPPPTLVSLDLRINVCVLTGWLTSDVEAGVLARLSHTSTGFFFADSFTFGTPLYRSALEAAIQSVPGVKGVLAIDARRRGSTNLFTPLPPVLQLGSSELLRIANDPNYPERGTIRVLPEGGR